MSGRFRHATALGLAALMLALASSGALAFSASFQWCRGASPSFKLADVPQGTMTLRFTMTDLNKPTFRHGGGSVRYGGQSEVPCGAFSTGFIGPAPPPGEVHTYSFTILALGVDDTLLATTTAQRKYPE